MASMKKAKPSRKKGQADDAAGEVHPARPEEAEGEREDGAGDGADGEEHGGDDGPSLGHHAVELLAGAQVEPLGGEEERGQADADGGEDDVEAEGHAHEGAGRGYGIEHVPALRGTPVRGAGNVLLSARPVGAAAGNHRPFSQYTIFQGRQEEAFFPRGALGLGGGCGDES